MTAETQGSATEGKSALNAGGLTCKIWCKNLRVSVVDFIPIAHSRQGYLLEQSVIVLP